MFKHISEKTLKLLGVLLLTAFLIEMLVFNRHSILSAFGSNPTELEFIPPSTALKNDDGSYILATTSLSFDTTGVNCDFNYIFIDAECTNNSGEKIPVKVKFTITDEGNSTAYTLPETKLYSGSEKTKYIRAHSYGDVSSLRITFSSNDSANLTVNKIVYDAKVPCFFSVRRFILIFCILLLLWNIRPASPLYKKEFTYNQKCFSIYFIFVITLAIWLLMTHINTIYTYPGWSWHHQYHNLAVALSKGDVSIKTGFEEIVSSISNPYDTSLRREVLGDDFYSVWDLSFFKGKFYVYFGIVPVLLFYLPYYLIFHSEFPTFMGIFIAGAALLAGVFYLIRQLINNFFKETPFLLYLVLSVVTANSLGTIVIMSRPDFYSLPIICAMAFTVWGLGIWLSAAREWKNELQTVSIAPKININIEDMDASDNVTPEADNFVTDDFSHNDDSVADSFSHNNDDSVADGFSHNDDDSVTDGSSHNDDDSVADGSSGIKNKVHIKLCVGSLLMALVAGCRPQFLVGSFFIFFIFAECIRSDFCNDRQRLVKRTIFTVAPYIIVAAGLMYYNYIRFGSPFDFGANYNLTTNDMTHRGFNVGRLADGIFQYLLQLPNISYIFPYVSPTDFDSAYIGTTIKEMMFGGVFFTHIILLVLPFIKKVKKQLSQKKLMGMTITSIIFALVVVIADTEMAGLLYRYYSDFLWLLLIPAVIIILQLWENYNTDGAHRMIVYFILIAGCFGIFIDIAIGLNITNIETYSVQTFYMLKGFFS